MSSGFNSDTGEKSFHIGLAFTVIGIVFCLTRLYIRYFIIKKPGWEDGFIAVALLFATAFTILLRVQETYGLGMHITDLSLDDLMSQLKV
jgi:hypothetical protein